MFRTPRAPTALTHDGVVAAPKFFRSCAGKLNGIYHDSSFISTAALEYSGSLAVANMVHAAGPELKGE